MNDLFIPTSSIDRDFRPIHVSNFGRQGHDFYPTPTWVTQTLLDRVTFRGPVWEPCCGDGAIARQIEARGNRVAVLAAGSVIKHDFGAQRAGVGQLHLRRVRRHDDGRANAQPPRCPGDTLGMVAAGNADHAARFLLV